MTPPDFNKFTSTMLDTITHKKHFQIFCLELFLPMAILFLNKTTFYLNARPNPEQL